MTSNKRDWISDEYAERHGEPENRRWERGEVGGGQLSGWESRESCPELQSDTITQSWDLYIPPVPFFLPPHPWLPHRIFPVYLPRRLSRRLSLHHPRSSHTRSISEVRLSLFLAVPRLIPLFRCCCHDSGIHYSVSSKSHSRTTAPHRVS